MPLTKQFTTIKRNLRKKFNCKLKPPFVISSLSYMTLCCLAAACLFLCTTTAQAADLQVLNNCDYQTVQDARKSWTGTYPVKINQRERTQGTTALVLPCHFSKPGARCYWNNNFRETVDLSKYKYISFDLYYSGKSIGYRAFYLGYEYSEGGKKIAGWYSYMLRFPLKKGWNRFDLKRSDFLKGKAPVKAWSKITKLRISLWGNPKDNQEILVDNFYASNNPKNSPFDIRKVKGKLYNDSDLTILPEPQQIKPTGTDFQISSASIPIYTGNNEASKKVLTLASEDFKVKYNIDFEKKLIPSLTSEKIIIWGNVEKARLILPGVKRKKLQPEGYFLTVCNEYILLFSKQEKGLYYGTQTLQQLIQLNKQKTSVSGVEITDFPGLKMRAIYLHRINDLKKTKQVLKILSALKFNYVFIDLASTIKYRNVPFPGSGRNAYSREQMLELNKFAQKHYLTICPYYQFFSHVNWIAAEPRYRHLLENPKIASWMSSWCPANPETYEFAFAILDEAVEIFNPPYIHVAHDEIEFTDLGSCPRCKGKSKEALVADSINKITEHLKSKNVKTIIWADGLLNKFQGKGKFNFNAKKLAGLLNPGLIMNGWYYGHNRNVIKKDIKILKGIKDPFIYSPFDDDSGIRIVAEEMQKNGGLGALMTLWHKWGTFGNFPTKLSSDVPGLIGISANYFWNPKASPVSFEQFDWNSRIRRFYQPGWDVPSPHRNALYEPVDLKPYINCKFADKKQIKKVFGINSMTWPLTFKLDGQSIKSDGGVIVLNNNHKKGNVSSNITIPINRKTPNIIFVQCLKKTLFRKYWEQLHTLNAQPKVGEYKIIYDDESSKTIALKFRFNIETWNSRTGIYDGKLLWQGKSRNNSLVRLWSMLWENPFPEKKISKIEFSTNSISGMDPMLFALIVEK